MAANNTQQGDEVLADDTKRLRDAWLAGKASGRVAWSISMTSGKRFDRRSRARSTKKPIPMVSRDYPDYCGFERGGIL